MDSIRAIIYKNVEIFMDQKTESGEVSLSNAKVLKDVVIAKLAKCRNIESIVDTLNTLLTTYPVLYEPLISIDLKELLQQKL